MLSQPTVVDGQMQSDGAVATHGIRRRVGRRIGGCRVGGAMPCIGVAGSLVFDSCAAVVDGQMQSDSAVATHGVGGSKCRRMGGGRVGAAMPRVGVASGGVHNACCAIVNS